MARRQPEHPGWYTFRGKIIDLPPWVPETPELPANPLDAVPQLCRFATHVWDSIGMAFGSSEQLVRLGYVVKKNHRLMGDWVRHLELLVRRIVMIAALGFAHLKPSNDRRVWGAPRIRAEVWHDPSSWKVSFRMFPAARRASRSVRKPPRDRRVLPAWPLARRIEAIRRVLSYLPGCTKRFARAMQRMRLRNANQKRRLDLGAWDFHPERRTPGKHAVNTGLILAQPLAEIVVDILLEPG